MKLTAVSVGWALEIAGVANSLVFLSGAKAETAARRIGARLARAGCAAEVEIYLRGGDFGRRFACVDGDAPPVQPRRLSRGR